MSNQYKKKAKKKSLLGELSHAEKEQKRKELKEALIETAKQTPADIGAAIGGGFIGAAIGKASLITGALVSGISHFFKKNIGDTVSRIGSVMGVGIMAGGFSKPASSVNGTLDDCHTDAVKARIKNFGSDLRERLYVDSIPGFKKTTTSAANKQTKTMGETQTFIYPQTEPTKKEVDLSALDEFENGLHKSAAEYQQNNQSTEGLGESDNELNPDEKNY